jgi:hypothetical protein
MLRLKLAVCAAGFAMLGGLALAQTSTNSIPTGGNGANTTPYTEGTLNGNHGSSGMSSGADQSTMGSKSTIGTDNSVSPNPGMRSTGGPSANSKGLTNQSQGSPVTPNSQ